MTVHHIYNYAYFKTACMSRFACWKTDELARLQTANQLSFYDKLSRLDLAKVGAMDAEDIQDMLQKCMDFSEDHIEFASAQQML